MTAMRRALEFLFTRALRSRIGVALALAVVVFGIIGAARLVSGPTDSPAGVTGGPRHPISTVDPEAGDDGATAVAEPPPPRTSPGALTPERTAERFATAWLGGGRDADEWQAAMRPLSTPALTEKLRGADPAGVPAERVTGAPTLLPRTETTVEVTVPLDLGRLRLTLVGPDGRWLVDEVDWERE
ncbi:hypothetical protein AB0H57_02535 [Micromonospora sp. NPDC050686]|uniref:hypothetical protein n=1 Tax=Micromonospora sp. NPDC050686 TaxID=3154631 RepID=UPI0033DCADC7